MPGNTGEFPFEWPILSSLPRPRAARHHHARSRRPGRLRRRLAVASSTGNRRRV